MGRTCAFCKDTASVEYDLPRQWTRLVRTEFELPAPPDGRFSLPLCGRHAGEIHELQGRHDEQTGFDLEGHEAVIDQVRARLGEVPKSAYEASGADPEEG